MPTISMFFGILVFIFYYDNEQHHTPHIHVRYQGEKASIGRLIMEILLDVISVTTREDYTLDLVFENGEKRIFDMKPLFDKKPFVKLLNSPLFFKASVQYGTVVWPGNIDIAPETLWNRSVQV